MLAATDVSFTQKTIFLKEHMQRLAQAQLPFGQLPLLQIDGIELVQSQAIIRYLACRANLQGRNKEEIAKCDMIAEAVKDLLGLLTAAPWKRVYTDPSDASATSATASDGSKTDAQLTWERHLQLMKNQFAFIAARFEAIIRSNRANLEVPPTEQNMNFLVGSSMTYCDILVAHITTWYVEECGSEIMQPFPLVTLIQNYVISLPGVQKFIKSLNYFPLSGREYCEQVRNSQKY